MSTPTAAEQSQHVLMLGNGWFPDELGGLERYFRELFERTPGAHGVVIGPARAAPPAVVVTSDHGALLPLRLLAYWRAVERALPGAALVDAHFALYASIPVLLGRSRRLPLVVHFQGPWAEESIVEGDNSLLRHIVRRRLEHAVYSRAGAIVVLTSAFRQLLVERYGVSPWRVRVLAPGVDLDAFTPQGRARARAALGLDGEAFVVCCVRRLVPRMGLETLLDAWGELAAQVAPQRELRLLIAGGGPLAQELAARARDPALPGVRLLGRVSERELVDLYRAADVNVVPSVAHEGFGLTVLEAAACGTPSLVTRVGGLPEAVRGLGRDLVVAPADPHALVARLRDAMDGQPAGRGPARAEHANGGLPSERPPGGRLPGGGLPGRDATRAWAGSHSWEQVAARHREIFAWVLEGSPRNRLRVVYLGHVARLSGGEIALMRLLEAMPEIDAHVILGEDGPLVSRLNEAGISVEVMPLRDRTRDLGRDSVSSGALPLAAGGDTARYTLMLARRLRALRPDLVHTNTLKAGVYGSVAARLAGLPVVWHVRDRISPDYLPAQGVRLVRGMLRTLPQAVVANSHDTAATVRLPASRRDRLAVIGEVAAGLATAPPRARGGGGRGGRGAGDGDGSGGSVADSLVVGMVGRLSPWKGQDVFLRAFARAFPDGEARGVIVGSAMFGEDGYAHSLRDLAQRLKLTGRVEFRGFREDVDAELDDMDVLVHASTIPEPFGQVVLEGIARGLPVIAAQAGGPAEIIAHERTGLLYSPGDVDALAAALTRMAGDPALRARLAEAGPRRARDFAPAVVAEQMLAVYSRAARRGRREAGHGGAAEPSSSPR